MKKYVVQKLLGQHVPIIEGGRVGGSEIWEIKRDPLRRRKSAAEDHL